MKICIGIISYLPDSNGDIRFDKVSSLLNDCDRLFGLPILIVAQNWKERVIRLRSSRITYYRYKGKLGITGAREKLREKFLESDYDYMIMLDDDSKLIGTKEQADEYVKQITEHPGMFGNRKRMLLKLFAVSKDIMKLEGYDGYEPANGEVLEDMYFIMKLEKKYPDKQFSFTKDCINEESDSSNDPNSTWFFNQFDKYKMGKEARRIVDSL